MSVQGAEGLDAQILACWILASGFVMQKEQYPLYVATC